MWVILLYLFGHLVGFVTQQSSVYLLTLMYNIFLSVSYHYTCHRYEDNNEDHLATLKHYAEHYSAKKYNLDLALQEKLNNPS